MAVIRFATIHALVELMAVLKMELVLEPVRLIVDQPTMDTSNTTNFVIKYVH